MPDVTPRLGLPFPLAADTADVPRDIHALALAVDQQAAAYGQGTFAARPVSTPASPGVRGRFYYADDALTLYVDTGTAWVPAADLTAALAAMPHAGDLRFTARAVLDVGWLACDGASLARADEPALFAALGTTYGAADGAHFTLPDYRGRAPVGPGTGDAAGATAHALGAKVGKQAQALTAAEMPAHAHAVTDPGHQHGGGTGLMDRNNPHRHTFQYYYGEVGDEEPLVWGYTYLASHISDIATGLNWADINHAHSIPLGATGVTVQNTGGGAAQENRTPSTVCNVWIKT